MTLEGYNRLCKALPATHLVVQWGGAHVWKIGSKVLAIRREVEEGGLHVTFKESDMAWEIFRDAPGVRPAPYLASRGMKWLQPTDDSSLDDATLADLLRRSQATRRLTRRQRQDLGLEEDAARL